MSLGNRNSGTHFLNLWAYNRFRSLASQRSDSSISDTESIQSSQTEEQEEQGDLSLRIFLNLSAYNRFRSLVSRRSDSSISDAESLQSSHSAEQGRAQSLSWATRIEVATGVAKGLALLHDAESQVIHRNVKSYNILLDSDFNAKLSAFGLALAGPTGDMTHVTTEVAGTYGYIAPEYIATGHVSAKADVYSFGVVLLELLSGRQAFDALESDTEQLLVDWARPYLNDKRKLVRIVDPKLEGQLPKEEAHAMANLVSVCLCNDPKLRPRMSEVLAVLEKLQDPRRYWQS